MVIVVEIVPKSTNCKLPKLTEIYLPFYSDILNFELCRIELALKTKVLLFPSFISPSFISAKLDNFILSNVANHMLPKLAAI